MLVVMLPENLTYITTLRKPSFSELTNVVPISRKICCSSLLLLLYVVPLHYYCYMLFLKYFFPFKRFPGGRDILRALPSIKMELLRKLNFI